MMIFYRLLNGLDDGRIRFDLRVCLLQLEEVRGNILIYMGSTEIDRVH